MTQLTVQEYAYTVIFEPIQGGYRITAPAFEELEIECECQSLEEGREIARYALKEYIGILTKNNQPIPEEKTPPQVKTAGFTENIGVFLFIQAPK